MLIGVWVLYGFAVRLEGEYRQHEQAIQKMLASLRSLNRALDAKVDIKSDDYTEHRIDGHVNRLDEVIKTVCEFHCFQPGLIKKRGVWKEQYGETYAA